MHAKDELMQDLEGRIAPWCGLRRTTDDGGICTTETRVVRIRNRVMEDIAPVLAAHAPGRRLAIIADGNTADVAGHAIAGLLRSQGWAIQLHVLNEAGAPPLLCDEGLIEEVQTLLREGSPDHCLAVGAGTINDTVKMAAHRESIGASVFCTAPSMNGYTSAIAAILSDGVKTTQPCTPPVAIFVDPAILADAPYRLIASGIGDLYSKPVSNADWRLSSRLLGTQHSAIVMEIVEAGATLLEGVAPLLPQRDPDAIARLSAALMLSGLAMQAAGGSSPASGGEHLISHYIDMTAHTFDQPCDAHGCQVAVATLVTSRLYEHLRSLSPSDIDPALLASRAPDWSAKERRIHERFGPLAAAVLEHARRNHVPPEDLERRLRTLVEDWDAILADVGSTLRPSAELEAELRDAQCPTTFAEINVAPDRAWRAIAHAHDIRARYTILHLADELGILEKFASRELGIAAPHPSADPSRRQA